MQRPTLLLALSLLLSACSSFRPVPVTYKPAPPPVQVGNKATVWGELPSYEDRGYYFQNLRPANLVEPFRGHVVLDLKVGADGRVRDTAIFQSSGDEAVDRAMLNVHKQARYTLRLGPDDPAPYIVRYKVVVSSIARPPPSRSATWTRPTRNTSAAREPRPRTRKCLQARGLWHKIGETNLWAGCPHPSHIRDTPFPASL